MVLGPCLRLFQNSDDLIFSDSFPLHAECSLLLLLENSLSKWTDLWGERQGARPGCLEVVFETC